MKVLIDECAPKALRGFLNEHGHECRTVQEAGWSGKQNGELLALAEMAFDVFVTLDANLRYQQNPSGRKIGLVTLRGRTNRLSDLKPLFPACAAAIDKVSRGEMILVKP